MFVNLTRFERAYLLMYFRNAEVDVWNVYHDSARQLANELQLLSEDDSLTAGIED
jgi:hypothetical protein